MTIKCPACESTTIRSESAMMGYQYGCCEICGTIFVTDTINAMQIYKNYEEKYFESKKLLTRQRQGYDSYFDLQESLKISFEQKLKLITEKMESGNLLDIGCAYGTFLELASGQFNCFGLEISKYAARIAREVSCAKTIISNIEQSPFSRDHFDVVTMWDVIEHLRYPVSALKEAHRLLKPGGYCFISTDNIDSWLVKLLGKSWWSFAPPLHLCHFSIKSLKIAVQLAGGYDIREVIKDQRIYKFNEIIKHFGVAYQNRFLQKAADLINNKQIGRLKISINRPEQFVLILQKQS
jgi:2-polyprenyl-3-methyl-5-hydroxy-6-metoxy-1,4-benzoquinol methylase